MNNPLFFGHDETYDISINTQLNNICSLRLWDKGKKKYVYIFKVDKAHQVTNLTRPLLFDENDLVTILRHSNQVFADTEIESWKGKSGYSIVQLPNVYRIISYQKHGKNAKPRQVSVDIPAERVKTVWNEVFMKIPKGEFYAFEKLASMTADTFMLKRYFRDASGTFDKAKFQGSRTNSDYGKFYYYPCKIMEGMGLIERSGQNLKRVKDSWEEQTSLTTSYTVAHNEA